MIHKYLGNSEELLGDLNNAGQLLDVLHALLNGVGVVGTGGVQDILVLLDLTLSPLLVSRTTVLGNSGENAEQTEGSNGFLVHHVELVADSGDGKTGGSGEDGGLGDQRAAGESIEDRLSLLLGVFGRNVRSSAGCGEVDGSNVARRKGRPQAGSTYRGLAFSIGQFNRS
jgi:hypothetical protein